MTSSRPLETLTAEDFREIQGSRFRLTGGSLPGGVPVSVDAELTEVAEASGSPSAEFRAPFSLLFLGPLEPILPQGIYRLEHEQLGVLDLFLVPLGPAGPAMRYEAVFG